MKQVLNIDPEFVKHTKLSTLMSKREKKVNHLDQGWNVAREWKKQSWFGFYFYIKWYKLLNAANFLR